MRAPLERLMQLPSTKSPAAFAPSLVFFHGMKLLIVDAEEPTSVLTMIPWSCAEHLFLGHTLALVAQVMNHIDGPSLCSGTLQKKKMKRLRVAVVPPILVAHIHRNQSSLPIIRQEDHLTRSTRANTIWRIHHT